MRAYFLHGPRRPIGEIDFTPLKALEATRAPDVMRFRQSDLYRELKIWLGADPRYSHGYFPNSLLVYDHQPLYREIVEWLENNGVIKYAQEPAPPAINPPVAPLPPPAPAVTPPSPPSSAPAQGDLFDWPPPPDPKRHS